jgi:hypothetical protein
MSKSLKILRKALLFLLVGVSIYLIGIISWNFYLENRLGKKANRVKVGMTESEVIHIMGRPRYSGSIPSSSLEAGDWSNIFAGLLDCLPYREIQKIENLYYLGYFNFLFEVGSFRKKDGNLFVIVYFDGENKKVVCVRKKWYLS